MHFSIFCGGNNTHSLIVIFAYHVYITWKNYRTLLVKIIFVDRFFFQISSNKISVVVLSKIQKLWILNNNQICETNWRLFSVLCITQSLWSIWSQCWQFKASIRPRKVMFISLYEIYLFKELVTFSFQLAVPKTV